VFEVPDTTQIYTEAAIRALRDVHGRTHRLPITKLEKSQNLNEAYEYECHPSNPRDRLND
jgi:hypothetical protein